MARRNLFLVVSLLVMVGVLIAAVLLTEERPRPSVPGGGPASTDVVDGSAAAGSARTGGAGVEGDDPGAGRSEVPEFRLPGGAEPVAEVRVSGRLVDAEGAGVPGAALTYLGGLTDDLAGMFRERDSDGIAATTAVDGSFVFAVPGDGAGARLTLPRSLHRLFAADSSRALEIEAVREDLELGDLATGVAASVTGQVVDAAGQPVAGASVRVRRFSGFGGGRDDREVDAEGRFEVRGLEPGTHWVSVAARGFVPPTPVVVELEAGRVTEDVVLTVTEGASIAGVVVDDVGRPIEGARVMPLRRREQSPGVETSGFDTDESVETDRNGYFVLSGLEGDRASLRASRAGHASEMVSNVSIGAGTVEIRLDRLGAVQGTLTDPSGAPLVGSNVVVRSVGATMVPGLPLQALARGPSSAETDEQGRFEITGVRPGSVQLAANGDGHLPIEGRALELRPGSRVENVRLVAETGAGIVAVVVDPGGTRLAGAEVIVRPQPPAQPAVGVGGEFRMRATARRLGGGDPGGRVLEIGGDARLGSGTTDDEGTARIGGLPAGVVEVVATHPDWASPRPVAATLNRSGFVETILSMRPAGSVLVKVVDSSGVALADVPVRLRSLGGESKVQQGRSDDRGFARFEPLLAGSWEATLGLPPRARALAPGMSFSVAGSEGQTLVETARPVEVLAGDTTEIEMVRPVLTRIHGTVTGVGGVVAEARVVLRLADAPPFSPGWDAGTDAAGSYELDDVPAGSYVLEWSRSGDPLPHQVTLDVQSGTPEILRDLVLGGGGLRVLVTSAADGSPVAGARVAVERAREDGRPQMRAVMMMADTDDGSGSATTMTLGDPANEAVTNAEGLAELEGVPPGSFEVVVRHDDHTTARQADVSVVDGQVADVAVQIQPAGRIAGSLTGFAADLPARVAMVEVRAEGGSGEPRNEVVQGSSYRISGLEPGVYLVRARALMGEGEPGPEQRVTVEAGATATADLSLVP